MAGKYIFHFEGEWHRIGMDDLLDLYRVTGFKQLEYSFLLYDAKFCTDNMVGFDLSTGEGVEHAHLMCASVATLGLPVRTMKKLKEHGIRTVGYLICYSEQVLEGFLSLHPAEVKRIQEALEKRGLKLREFGESPTLDCLWRKNADGDFEPAVPVHINDSDIQAGGWIMPG